MSNEIMLQKIENTCQSTRTSDLSFELNSYTVYSHRDFFWLTSKPTSAAKQTIIFLHPGKHFKVFFNLQTTVLRCSLAKLIPAAWQV